MKRLWTSLLAAFSAAAAFAHPMGNFSINHYVRVAPVKNTVHLFYVLDMAELPTITERQTMDTDENNKVDDAEISDYLANRVPGWLAGMKATVDGNPLTWTSKASHLVFTPGAADLPTMRIEIEATTQLPPGTHDFKLDDDNYADRAGWREMVVPRVKGGAAPAGAEDAVDRSNGLRNYPENLVSAPPQMKSVEFKVDVPKSASDSVVKPIAATAKPTAKPAAARKPATMAKPKPVLVASIPKPLAAIKTRLQAQPDGPLPVTPIPAKPVSAKPAAPKAVPSKSPAAAIVKTPAPPLPAPAVTPGHKPIVSVGTPQGSAITTPASRRFQSLINVKHITPGLILVSLLVAFVLGAAHALQPGHGKTLVAAYLVGQRGTAKHAAILGLTVTISHTFGVFVLGIVALFLSKYILPEVLYPWLGFASGTIIAILGAGLLWGKLRGSPAVLQAHGHSHEGHTHEHGDHSHEHAEEHVHAHEAAHAGAVGHTHDHHHDHDHSHDHDHGHSHGESALRHSHGPFGEHSHDVPESLSIKSLLTLGISGGIVPCWDALIVLLGAVALHRIWYGLLLILAFSAGLATTLTAAGLAVVWGRRKLDKYSVFAEKNVRGIAIASHAVIMVLGIIIAITSLVNAGIVRWNA